MTSFIVPGIDRPPLVHRLSRCARALAIALVVVLYSGQHTMAAQDSALANDSLQANPNGSSPDGSPQPLELGRFKIRDLKPTKNQSTDLDFSIHLALAPTVSKETASKLQNCQHRLRDQVITAVRLAEANDFFEPGLDRLRRLIVLRSNRMLGASLVEEALVTEFTFSIE